MRAVARGLLLLLAFAIPWEYSLDFGVPLGNIARLIGVALLIVATPAMLQSGAARRPGAMHWLVVALFLWFCCTYFWTLEPGDTLERLRGYFQEMAIVWLVWEFAEGARDLRALLRAWLLGEWVLAVLTGVSLAWVVAHGGAQIRFVAVDQDPNDVARYLDLGFPVAALLLDGERHRLGRIFALGYFPVGLAAVLITGSRGGFAAAVVALSGCGAALLMRHRRSMWSVLAAVPVVCGALWFVVPQETLARIATITEQVQGGDLNQRVNIWEAGWRAFTQAPFLGHGAGSFVSAAGLATIDTAHNTALSIAVEAGICGVALMTAIVAMALYAALKMRGATRILLVTWLTVWIMTSMVGTTTGSRTTWLLFGVIALMGRVYGTATNGEAKSAFGAATCATGLLNSGEAR
jgi:O-antigen ligase